MANNYGPTIIVAASDAGTTSRAQFVANGTNDQETIEAAMAALPSSGGTVMLTEGTFSINDEINITASGTRLIGQGSSTRLQMTATSTNWDMIDALSVGNIYVGHMQLDGALSSGASNLGIIFNDVSTSTIEHVYVHDMTAQGIYLQGGSHNLVSNNQSHDNTSYGIFTNNGSYSNVIAGNNTSGNSYGIYTFGATNTQIGGTGALEGNVIADAAFHAIILDAGSADTASVWPSL